MLTAFGLITTALEEVFLNRKAFTSMKVKFLTAFTAEEVTCILVHLALLIGAFATCKVPLHRVEQLSADDMLLPELSRIFEGISKALAPFRNEGITFRTDLCYI